jgi:hypothetical protein
LNILEPVKLPLCWLISDGREIAEIIGFNPRARMGRDLKHQAKLSQNGLIKIISKY